MVHIGLFLSFAVYALAAVLEELGALPRGWQKSTESLPDDQIVQLHVSLQYSNLDRLEEKLSSVSEPSSSTYGQYLELGELNDLFAPSEEREARVTSWLESHPDVNIFARDGNTISFVTTVARANQMLDTSFGLYTNGDIIKLGTLRYSVPDHLTEDIDLITPTTYFGRPRRMTPAAPRQALVLQHRANKQNLPECDVFHDRKHLPYPFVSSACYSKIYNIGNYTPEANSGSSIAFSSFLGQAASFADLETFTENYGIPFHNFTVLGLINGATNNQSTSAMGRDEANLDSQTIISVVGDLPVGEYIEKGLGAFIPSLEYQTAVNNIEPFLRFYQYLLSQPSEDLPWVISNSYADEEINVPKRYAQRTCNMIGMLGMRGRTLLAPAGDSGPGEVCLSANGKKKEFTPMFPSDCPYVTTVGGTQNTAPIVASSQGGGGFSNYFSRPSYQQDAVSTYLNKYIDPAAKEYFTSNGFVKFSGRGMPDISANFGPPYLPTILKGEFAPGGGTSEASPIVASIIALLNDARFKAGKPAMGFINPWLYKVVAGKGVTDVTKGQNQGCPVPNSFQQPPKGTPNITYATWNATVGWDPVTGIGYPNFGEMLKLC